MSEQKQAFILCFLTLVFGILLLLVILTNNALRDRNLLLNEYAIYNCGITKSEIITEYKRP
jgi:hypothetical protein